jgi:threonine/homoserine/homoserine lactone efflux protein
VYAQRHVQLQSELRYFSFSNNHKEESVIGINHFALFIITSIIIIVAPGPDFLYVTTRGVSQGKKAGTISAAGVGVGLLIHTLLAAFGLSAIIQTSRIAYLGIKYIGASYLIYLGIRALMTKNNLLSDTSRINTGKGVFHQGVLTNVFNPKAIITFMAFLPQFVDMKIIHPIEQFLFLGIIFSSLAVVWFGFVGYFAGLVGAFIKQSHVFQKSIQYISGSVLVLLGLRLALQEE